MEKSWDYQIEEREKGRYVEEGDEKSNRDLIPLHNLYYLHMNFIESQDYNDGWMLRLGQKLTGSQKVHPQLKFGYVLDVLDAIHFKEN